MTNEWLGIVSIILVVMLLVLGHYLKEILLLMEGPTERCRFCNRRYVTNFVGHRVCHRRECQKRLNNFRKQMDDARAAGDEDLMKILQHNFDKGIC